MPLLLSSLLAAADATTAPGLRWAACAAFGLAGAVLGWWMVRVLQSEDIAQGAEWRYDVSRINELRRGDPLYRLFQPLITLLAHFNRVLFPHSLAEIHRQIQAAGLPRFWLPEEYLARAELLALFAVPLVRDRAVSPAGAERAAGLGLDRRGRARDGLVAATPPGGAGRCPACG